MTAAMDNRWNGWRIARWSVAAALLLTPLVAMQFTPQVQWSVSNFVLAAIMIVGAGLVYEVAAGRGGGWSYRAGAAVALATGFAIIWINLAVGIVGDSDNPANISFFALVAMAGVAGIAAGFRADGLARGLACVAFGQAFVGAMVATAPVNAGGSPGPVALLALNLAFALCWLLAAVLFRRAARAA